MLHDLGCDTAGPRIERAGTIAVIVSPDGARRFLTDRGTITPWGPPEPEWLDGARRVHFTAYALCDPLSSESCLALAKVATTRGIPISVDPSSVSMLAEFGVDRFGELLVELGADLLLPNREEAELLGVLTGAHPFAAVVTNGAAPTLARMLDGTDLHVEVAPTVAVDTTGAGDAFAAGFLAAFDEGASMTDSIRLGHDTAARVVGGMGAGAWDTPGHDESRHTTR
jgi:sugar/nucleoside kinase (ribokinase family)